MKVRTEKHRTYVQVNSDFDPTGYMQPRTITWKDGRVFPIDLPKDEDDRFRFASASFDAEALAANPALELVYIVAPPRMKYYEEVSTKIFGIYKKYISPEDIHVYSIDECFIDATAYLETYHLTARELAMSLIREVLFQTGITATAGIGTNLYLAKIAMLFYRKVLYC